jgi:hypothetical protein
MGLVSACEQRVYPTPVVHQHRRAGSPFLGPGTVSTNRGIRHKLRGGTLSMKLLHVFHEHTTSHNLVLIWICNCAWPVVYDMIWYIYIYLTAVGFTPGGSSTSHIYRQTVHLHTNSTHNTEIEKLGSAGRAPSCELYPGICLTTEEKSRKNLSINSVWIVS